MPKICNEFAGKESRDKYNVVINTKPNANHAALTAPLERQVEKKIYTYDTDSEKQANTQGMCVSETKAILVKRQGWGLTLGSVNETSSM